MTRRLGVAEILKKISDLPNEIDRQNSLATCSDNTVLVMTLKYMFDPNIVFDLPDGDPPYKPTDFLDQESSYYTDFRRMYLFIKGGNPNLSAMKRETLFVQFIEGLDKQDAKLVLAMKDKKSPYPGITYDLVYRTFPGLLPEKQEEINTIIPTSVFVPILTKADPETETINSFDSSPSVDSGKLSVKERLKARREKIRKENAAT